MVEENLSEIICDLAMQAGFDACGIVPAGMLPDFEDFLRQRMTDVPESVPFYTGLSGLTDVKTRFPWAKAVIILICDYGKFRFPEQMQGRYAKAFFLDPLPESGFSPDMAGFETALAIHNIRAEGGAKLGAESVGMLRLIAAKAGLGIIRRNNFFYTENGSYCNLVGYVIDRECTLIRSADLPPCPAKCRLCQKACRTASLMAPYTMNPFRCVSFLTTFGNCGVPAGLHPDMFEAWVCGCDNCQDACPFNRRHDWKQGDALPGLDALAPVIMPDNYSSLSDEFLIENVIPRTAGHLQPSQVSALRMNAARSARWQQE